MRVSLIFLAYFALIAFEASDVHGTHINVTFTFEDFSCQRASNNASDFCQFEANSEVLDAFESYKTTPIKSIIGLNLIVRLTLGNFFYLALVHYEKYGGDPKKRTTINQILSLICLTLVINSLVSQPIVAWSIILGPIPGPLANFALFEGGATHGMLMVCFAEIVIFQNLLAFKFPTFSCINEDFLARFVTLWNIGFIYGSFFGLWYLDDFPVGPFEFLTGTLTGKVHHRGNEFWFVVSLATAAITTIGTMVFHLKKYLDKKKDLNSIPIVAVQTAYNNQAKNDQIISKSAITLIVIGTASILLWLVCNLENNLKMVHGTIFSDIVIDCCIGLIVPFAVLIKNQSFRSHLMYSLS